MAFQAAAQRIRGNPGPWLAGAAAILLVVVSAAAILIGGGDGGRTAASSPAASRPATSSAAATAPAASPSAASAPLTAGPTATLPPVGATPPVGAAPSVTAAPSPVGTPSAAPSGDWAGIAVAPYVPAADLVADQPDVTAVAADTTFTLRSRSSTPAVDLAARITTQPPLALVTEPGTDASTVRLRPTERLAAGVTYRFVLTAPGGAIADSWAFRAAAPLHVVTTVPDHESTEVPVDTGIEIVFDQDGVTDAAGHVTIEPPVAGRFEQRARTLVFIPDRDLQPETVYTVTVRPGISIADSEQVLEEEVAFAFETAGAAAPTPGFLAIEIDRAIVESAVAERPVLGLRVANEDVPVPRSLRFEVHRLPSRAAAVAAARQILTAPDWARWSSFGLVPTDGLPRAAAFDGVLEEIDDAGGHVVRFPTALDAGWYLIGVERDGRDAQALLQVTDVAVYAMTTETQTLAWVNDAATGRPVAGATVTIAEGAPLGRTGADGLLVVPTPDALRSIEWEAVEAEPPVLVIAGPDGRSAIAAPGIPSYGVYAPETRTVSRRDEPDQRYWLVVSTDRTDLRTSDTLNVYGVVRERKTGRVPREVDVRLTTGSGDGVTPGPAIVHVLATPDARGVFTASAVFRDLPLGGYPVEVWADGRLLATTYVRVADIRKPAYTIEVTTRRHAYVVGERMRVTASVAFFDGTLAPGVELRIRDEAATTDAAGRASVLMTAGEDVGDEGWSYDYIEVRPARPEEGEITGYAAPVVFPSNHWLAATGTLASGRLRVTGTLSALDRDRIEAELGALEELTDPAGDPIAGATVTATIIEMVPVRTQTGRRYDFIAKRVVTTYAYEIRETQRGRETLRTRADGTFALDLRVAAADHDYAVVLRSVDPDGLAIQRTLHLSPPRAQRPNSSQRPILGNDPVCGYGEATRYRVGEPMTAIFRNADGPLPTGDGHRFLFTVSSQGLIDAIVQASPEFDAPYTEAMGPNATVGAVWFTGTGYVPTAAPLGAALELSDRSLTVTVEPDRERYAPGEQVTVTIRTLDRAGRPVRASVVLRAVDEKLYRIGGAGDIDLRAELYRLVDSGVLGTFASHQPPFPLADSGCGDTTGGGEDFRDWLLFRAVETGADGTARVTFGLSDDLTSWHVSAAALSDRLEAGVGSTGVPVGLPFFVEAVLAPQYVLGDRPVLQLRGFGSGLDAGDEVRFSVQSESLGLPPTPLAAAAFETAGLALPPLAVGEHRVIITAEAGAGADRRTYRLVRTFTVVPARVTRAETRVVALEGTWRPDGAGTGLTTVTVSDAGRGRLLSILGAMLAGTGARLDQALAAAVARDLLVTVFEQPEWTLPPAAFDASQFEREGGLALFPYSGADLVLTARAALAAPDRLDRDRLGAVLGMVALDAATTRERRVLALAGLAALGAIGPAEIQRLAREPDLTIRERLYIGIALAELGDDAGAREIERDLLAEHGRRLGPWVRLEVGTTLEDTLEATGLLALLAASLGDPIAAEAQAYVQANPGADDLFVLHQLTYVRRTLERADPTPGRFAVTVAGARTVRNLDAGAAWSITVTPEQLAGLQVEPLGGTLAVTTVSAVPLGSAPIEADPDVTIERIVSPAGDVPPGRLVHVALTVRFGPQATAACYEVNDRLPSGLAPLVRLGRPIDDGSGIRFDRLAPYLVEGQRVSWCIAPDDRHRVFDLGYSARVVGPGTYGWEPATVQSTAGGDRLTATPPTTITIR